MDTGPVQVDLNPPQLRHWRTEAGAAFPEQVASVDDQLTADRAIRRLKAGEYLVYRGDFHNARQLLSAVARRIRPSRGDRPRSTLETFLAQRAARDREHQILGKLLVELDVEYQLTLRRAPDVAEACQRVWGTPAHPTLTALTTLNGVMGAAEWRRRGLSVPGLPKPLRTDYGVYLPTRTEYLELLDFSAKGKTVFDIGCGSGVLSLMLLTRGAKSAVATDIEPRAVRCAKENGEAFGFSSKMTVVEQDLFPDGTADIVICNPPWVPAEPKNRFDAAVFDPGEAFLLRFLAGLPSHLSPAGTGYLIISDLPELFGLRPHGALAAHFEKAGLAVVSVKSTQPSHPKASDRSDPLYTVRSKETTSLYALQPAR